MPSNQSLNGIKPRKPIHKRWWFWLIMAFLIIILGILITLYYYYYFFIQMSDEMVANANEAVSKGITVSDDRNDFVMLGSNKEELNAEDNPSPYRLGFFDIKSVSLGADQDWLYIKYTFYDTIPQKDPDVDGDYIEAIGAKAELVDNEGSEYGGTGADFGWVPVFHIPATDSSYFYGPTGIEWPESARYTGEGRDSKVSGGSGTDFIMGAFPLSKFGIKYGDTINIRFPMEVKSNKFTHAAVDVLRGEGKSPSLITWTVGSNKFSESIQKEFK